MDSRKEGFAQFVVARGNAAEVFELIEKTFDAVALAIARLVIGEFLTASADGGNHRFDAIVVQALADAIGVVAFIERCGLQNIVGQETVIQAFKLPAIMRVPGAQVERDAAVFINRGRMDFGGKSPARPPQSLLGTLFFGAPAAC